MWQVKYHDMTWRFVSYDEAAKWAQRVGVYRKAQIARVGC